MACGSLTTSGVILPPVNTIKGSMRYEFSAFFVVFICDITYGIQCFFFFTRENGSISLSLLSKRYRKRNSYYLIFCAYTPASLSSNPLADSALQSVCACTIIFHLKIVHLLYNSAAASLPCIPCTNSNTVSFHEYTGFLLS